MTTLKTISAPCSAALGCPLSQPARKASRLPAADFSTVVIVNTLLQYTGKTLMSEKVLSPTKLDPVADFKEGVALLKNGYAQAALVPLRRAFECEKRNPYYLSFLGLSIARAERKWDQAAELCEIAVQLKRQESQFHLNLAEVYQLAGRNSKAIDTLDAALELFGNDDRLKRARSRIEKRRTPVLSFLNRDNVLNRKLGKLRHQALKRVEKQD
jgi:Flp pilus assembly protein TadD